MRPFSNKNSQTLSKMAESLKSGGSGDDTLEVSTPSGLTLKPVEPDNHFTTGSDVRIF
jgi:hypothetical protein